MILAGDVGGTKVHLALFEFIDGNLAHVRDQRYPAKEYGGLEEIVKAFIVSEKVTAACFGVPGPVRDGHLRLPKPAMDTRQPRTGGGSQDRLRVSDQRSSGQRIRDCGVERRPDIHTERGRCTPDR